MTIREWLETISHVEDSLKYISDCFLQKAGFAPLFQLTSLQFQACVKMMSVHLNTATE